MTTMMDSPTKKKMQMGQIHQMMTLMMMVSQIVMRSKHEPILQTLTLMKMVSQMETRETHEQTQKILIVMQTDTQMDEHHMEDVLTHDDE